MFPERMLTSGSRRAFLGKVWSADQQHQRHQECRLSCLPSDLLNHNLRFELGLQVIHVHIAI